MTHAANLNPFPLKFNAGKPLGAVSTSPGQRPTLPAVPAFAGGFGLVPAFAVATGPDWLTAGFGSGGLGARGGGPHLKSIHAHIRDSFGDAFRRSPFRYVS